MPTAEGAAIAPPLNFIGRKEGEIRETDERGEKNAGRGWVVWGLLRTKGNFVPRDKA